MMSQTCECPAPLLRTMLRYCCRHSDNATRAIITNRDIIAVSQDPNGSSGYRIWKQNDASGGSTQLWKGELSNKSVYSILDDPTANENHCSTYVMAVLNATPMNQSVTVSMYDFFIDNNRTYAGSSFNLFDLWQNSSLYQNVTGSFSVQVPTHGVRLFKVVKA